MVQISDLLLHEMRLPHLGFHSNFIAGRPKAVLLFCSLVIIDVVCRYLSLFLLYINIEIGKNRCLMLD